jgi:hypothetical protein
MDRPFPRHPWRHSSMDTCLRRYPRGERCTRVRTLRRMPGNWSDKPVELSLNYPPFQRGGEQARQGRGDQAEFRAQATGRGRGQGMRFRAAAFALAIKRPGEAPGIEVGRFEHLVEGADAGEEGRGGHRAGGPDAARKQPGGFGVHFRLHPARQGKTARGREGGEFGAAR